MPTLVGGQRRAGMIRTRTNRGGILTIEQDFHFRIRADSLEQDRLTVLHHPSLDVPKYGYPYGSYGMSLKSADGDRHADDPLLWDAVYNLSNVVEEGEHTDPANGHQQDGTPVEWQAVVTLGFEDNDEVFRKSLAIKSEELHPDRGGTDADGYNAMFWTNSAGEPYQTGFVRQRRVITRDFTQFERISGPGALTLDDIENRNDVLNSDTFLGKPKRTIKLTVESCEAGSYFGLRCWRVGYKLHYKKTDWRLKQLDVGSFYIESEKKIPFEDEQGNSILGSLDGKGAKATDQNEPAMRYHKEFDEIDFNDILRMA
jgi:hypothetical protein